MLRPILAIDVLVCLCGVMTACGEGQLVARLGVDRRADAGPSFDDFGRSGADGGPGFDDFGRSGADGTTGADGATGSDARTGADGATGSDARTGSDAAGGSRADLGARDGATAPDSSGLDGRSGPTDGGGRDARVADARPPSDAAALDAARPPDAGPRVDASPDAAPDSALIPDALLVPDVDPNLWRFPPRDVCGPAYAEPVEAAVLADAALIEVSGIVPSPTTPGLLWLHNDSGDAARLFAARTDGARLGRIFLPDVAARDFEDIGAGPCPDRHGPCLWVADIGNNRHNRADLAVYLIDEPAVDPAIPFADRFSGPVQRYPFHYPMAAAPDAEAMLVAPDGSTFYILEKIDWDRARVWMHPGPLVPDVDTELVALHDFPNPGVNRPGGRMITGASMHPGGQRILVRVYSGVYEYRFDAGGGLDRLDLAAVSQVVLGPASEAQGEAVTYDESGTGVYTISEGVTRALHAYACPPGP